MLIPTTRIEPTMNALRKTANKIFNALAFANVSNLGEFRTLLRQIDEADATANEVPPRGTISQPSTSTPLVGHIQGAL
jgi:hypothetical protein